MKPSIPQRMPRTRSMSATSATAADDARQAGVDDAGGASGLTDDGRSPCSWSVPVLCCGRGASRCRPPRRDGPAMNNRIVYAGDADLVSDAGYLAGVLTHAGLPFDYVPSDTPLRLPAEGPEPRSYVLSDYPVKNLTAADFGRIVRDVERGGGLLMIGGWESFHGAAGEYHRSPAGIRAPGPHAGCGRPRERSPIVPPDEANGPSDPGRAPPGPPARHRWVQPGPAQSRRGRRPLGSAFLGRGP